MSGDGRVRILVACTGNICRSPFAALLLKQRLARVVGAFEGSSWTQAIGIGSAGIRAMLGEPMTPEMLEVASSHGVDGSGHRARQVEPEIVGASDLVLALTREHRRDLVAMQPRASRRAFTLVEFARLLEDAVGAETVDLAAADTPVAAFEELIEAAANRRGFAIPPLDPADDDIEDPYGGTPERYAAVGERIAETVARIESALSAALRTRAAVGR